MAGSRSFGVNGLTTYARAPASLARSTSSFWLKAVSSTTGAMWSLLSFSAAEMPSSWGIFTSMITRSGRSSVARATAVSPSPASPTTSNPLSRRISTMSRRMSDSSSATTTRRGVDAVVAAVCSCSVTCQSYGMVVRGRAEARAGRCGGMADATDSNSVARKGVWVRLPPPAPRTKKRVDASVRGIHSSSVLRPLLLVDRLDHRRVRIRQRLDLLGRAEVDVGGRLLVELGRHLERTPRVVHLRLAVEQRERHHPQHDESDAEPVHDRVVARDRCEERPAHEHRTGSGPQPDQQEVLHGVEEHPPVRHHDGDAGERVVEGD